MNLPLQLEIKSCDSYIVTGSGRRISSANVHYHRRGRQRRLHSDGDSGRGHRRAQPRRGESGSRHRAVRTVQQVRVEGRPSTR